MNASQPAFQLLAALAAQLSGAPELGRPAYPCDVWKPLAAQVEELRQADSKQEVLASLVAVENNALGQIEAARQKCENLAGVQHQICENQVVTSSLPDCASLAVQQRRDHLPCTRRLPGGAQPAPQPVDETAIDKCVSARMGQLANDNSVQAQQVTDWVASHDAAKAQLEADARQAAEQAEMDRRSTAKVLKEHPEVPVEAISAVVCRVEQYRKWVVERIDKDKRYSHLGGTLNLTRRYGQQQLVRFLDDKKADATMTLKERFRSRPRPCSSSPVKALATCVVPPVLLGQDEEPLARDPDQPCAYAGPHIDWFTSDKPESPAAYWYLGSDWFQPTTMADSEN